MFTCGLTGWENVQERQNLTGTEWRFASFRLLISGIVRESIYFRNFICITIWKDRSYIARCGLKWNHCEAKPKRPGVRTGRCTFTVRHLLSSWYILHIYTPQGIFFYSASSATISKRHEACCMTLKRATSSRNFLVLDLADHISGHSLTFQCWHLGTEADLAIYISARLRRWTIPSSIFLSYHFKLFFLWLPPGKTEGRASRSRTRTKVLFSLSALHSRSSK